MKRAARPRGLTLGAYLAVAFSALSILLTVVLTVVVERTASRGLATSIGQSLAELATQTASRLDRGMFERYREVQLMAQRLQRTAPADVQAELDAAKASYRYYAWLGLTDAKGVVQAASGGLLAGQDVSGRPWFSLARAGVHLGDVHEAVLLSKLLGGEAGGEPQRFYDVAFPTSDGRVLGAHVSWDWARDVRRAVFNADRGNESVEPLIVAADGTVLLGPAGTEGLKLTLTSFERARSGEDGFVTERWPDGQEYLVGYGSTTGFQSSPGLGWKVLVRQPVAIAYEPLRTLQWRVFWGGLALASLFSVLGWLAARAISRPLLQLAGQARRLERGQATQVETSSAYREVEVLGTALNSLLQNLQQKTGELHALNAELERRVEQRTAELSDAFLRVQANEQRIQTILEAAQDPFISMDLQGRISDWNTQAEVVFGWAREDVLGRRASEVLLPKRYAGALEAVLEAYLRTGDAAILHQAIERVMVDRQGREIPVEVKVGLVNTGNDRFFSAFIHDISQRKEVERMKDEFVSTVSHELRTPLTAIYGSLSLLSSGMAGELPEDVKQLLAISHESTERLIRLINDLLDLDKMASGKLEYRMQVQPLRPLLEHAVRDTQAYAEGLRVQFRMVGDEQARVNVDADRIVQVCVNLLSNAAKFSPQGGDVEVGIARLEPGWVRVWVADRGPGVPPEFRDRMFQRFAQADASDRRARGGTGLGLSICRSIVEAHGGRMGFTTEPDVRTEFYFELPEAD
ncbi:MAG: ATP-binding protein [Ramlibacter sp.]